MHISLVRSFVLFVAVFIAVSFETGCVGVTSAVKPASAATVPGSVAITITPTNASVQVGGTQQFSAVVTGATDPSVTWSATGGTVSSDGLYTAPSATGTYAVTATSVADSTKSASATVSVTSDSPAVSVAVNPGSASIQAGATQQFTAAVSGTANYGSHLVGIWWNHIRFRPLHGARCCRKLFRDRDERGRFDCLGRCDRDGHGSDCNDLGCDHSSVCCRANGKYAAVQRNGYRNKQYGCHVVGVERIDLERGPLYGTQHRRHLHGESNQCR